MPPSAASSSTPTPPSLHGRDWQVWRLAADQDGERTEVLGDSAYGTGDLLDKINKNGWTATIKPHPLRPGGRGRVHAWTTSPTTRQAGTVTCPNQVTRRLSKTRVATFGKVCAGCPLRKQCTTSARGRVVMLTEHEQVRRTTGNARRQPEFQQTYRAKRPLVERSIAWLTRGNRRLRYRGVVKNNAWLHHRVAASEPASTSHPGTHSHQRDLGAGLTLRDNPDQVAASALRPPKMALRRAERPRCRTHEC